MRNPHVTTIRYSDIVGYIDTPSARAVCSCGWKTGWDNGWNFVTKFRIWRHRRKHTK